MSVQAERAITEMPSEEQTAASKRARNYALLRSLRGFALLSLAAILYSRAGYGPFGDPAQHGRPCTVSRCPHNATLVLITGVAALALSHMKHHQQQEPV